MTRPSFPSFPGPHRYPPKLRPGDRVAVVSPSWAGPVFFPHVFELGLERLKTVLDLEPVEYPTTRQAGASPAERAADLNEAWADPDIKAVLATIGGHDQIKVLPHLDAETIAGHPKPFLGFSDSTNLLLYLWDLGVVGYHGGGVMAHLARGGALHPVTLASLRAALFEGGGGEWELAPVAAMGDEDPDWRDPGSTAREPPMRPAEPWSWHGPAVRVTGPAWGGSWETIDMHLRVGRWLAEPDAYDGAVLVLETSEEQPDATQLHRSLVAMGERGFLQRFAAVLHARPKAWSAARPRPVAERAHYAAEQLAAVLDAVTEYHPGDGDTPGIPVVGNLDLGHTDPQVVVPMGGPVTVDLVEGRISLRY
ncbi:MAG TPA: S66 peptidase family protein [Acidimicrobiales bacterium]|nr:S66 peptidase family protein [Acidimicrobiales bacterium]